MEKAQEENLGEQWFSAAIYDVTQQVYDEIVVQVVEKAIKHKTPTATISSDINAEFFEAINTCYYSTLQQICEKNHISLRRFHQADGFLSSKVVYTLQPYTKRFGRRFYANDQDNSLTTAVISSLKEF